MGAVTRTLRVLFVAILAIAVMPVPGHALAQTYGRPFAAGPQGGDQFNLIQADAATGDMTVLRVNPAGISGGLGCGGSGGFANFEVTVPSPSVIAEIAVLYDSALVDPYTWINVGVRRGSNFVASRVQRGILVGGGTVVVRPEVPVQAPVTVRFGIQVASACPNVNGGHAVFTQVQASSL